MVLLPELLLELGELELVVSEVGAEAEGQEGGEGEEELHVSQSVCGTLRLVSPLSRLVILSLPQSHSDVQRRR